MWRTRGIPTTGSRQQAHPSETLVGRAGTLRLFPSNFHHTNINNCYVDDLEENGPSFFWSFPFFPSITWIFTRSDWSRVSGKAFTIISQQHRYIPGILISLFSWDLGTTKLLFGKRSSTKYHYHGRSWLGGGLDGWMGTGVSGGVVLLINFFVDVLLLCLYIFSPSSAFSFLTFCLCTLFC